MLAYPLHHTFAILSVSYKFTCLTLKEILLLQPGMLSLIKLFKPTEIVPCISFITAQSDYTNTNKTEIAGIKTELLRVVVVVAVVVVLLLLLFTAV